MGSVQKGSASSTELQKLNSLIESATRSALPKAKSKYGNRTNERDGEKYRSLRERHRHDELLRLQASGLIANLKREVRFVLAPTARIDGRMKPALRYFADFTYIDRPTGVPIVEDCKGVRTAVYRIKRHLMKTVHGIEIRET